MLNRETVEEHRRPLTRLLPGDDKVRLAALDCARDLERAQEALRQFRVLWFQHDPPRLDSARKMATLLEESAIQLRNSARELLRVSDPNPR